MRLAVPGVLLALCLACGPAPKARDADYYVPGAVPEGGPQPWEKGTPRPTAIPTPKPTPAAAAAAPASAPAALTPAELKAKVLALMREGVDQDLILAFLSRQAVSGRLSVDDILDWKKAGIADEVIKAAAAR